MKKRTLRKVIGLGALVSLTSFAFAEGGKETKAAVEAFFKGAKSMIVGGGVIAAAWGLYQVAFGNGSGKDWFLVVVGGALVGGYTEITGAIANFFVIA